MNSERNVSRTAENVGAVSAGVTPSGVHEKREAHGEVLRALSPLNASRRTVSCGLAKCENNAKYDITSRQ